MAERANPRRIPVLICGGGPVGLALAVELGMRCVPCMLVERRDGSVTVPKMNMVNARSMEFCRRWGVAEEIKRIGWPDDFRNNAVFVTTLTGYELARFDYPSYAERGELSYTPEGSRRISQIWFDPMLLRRAQALPDVDVRLLTELESFDQRADGVTAVLRDLETGTVERVAADWLVGCDGAESTVREAARIGIDGSMRISSSVSFFVVSDDLRRIHDKGDAWVYWCFGAEGYWGGIGSTNARELWRFSDYTFPAGARPTEAQARASVRRAIGRDHPFELKAILPWDRRSMVAERYVSGRVILAGDSAHSMSPTGGLGMNTGLGDAHALGWRLQALCQGWGGPGLLESYDLERRPIAEHNVAEATASFRKLDAVPRGPELLDASPSGDTMRAAFRRAVETGGFEHEFEQEGTVLGYDYYESPGIVPDGTAPPPFDPKTYSPQARTGHRAPHGWLRPDYSTIDLFNEGPFTLLRLGRDPEDASGLVQAAHVRGVPLQLRDVDRPEITELYDGRLVLVRPDGHVGWRGDAEPDDPGGVFDVLRGASTATTASAAA